MAMELIEHRGATGKTTFWAFPVGVSLSLWATYARQLVEKVAPDLGFYTITVDTSIASQWVIFDTSVGSTWGTEVADWDAKTSVSVVPVFGANAGTQRPAKGDVVDTVYLNEAFTLARTVTRNKAPVSLTGKTLVFTIEKENSANKFVARGADIVRSGTVNETYTVVIPASVTAETGELSFTLREEPSDVVLDFAKLAVAWAPHHDPD